ncbi:MAG: MurR/RpiR family transcriptional regulator [Oscillospiraceae bacterium]|nr:MurR/RpiR family transcriptional regulator [Oscillospiraceae bacterium]
MNNDILSLLQAAAPKFSKGQRLLARYITESYDKAAFMTASRLGKTVGVSESTVVRFAVELGYDGYPTMQKAMQEMVLNRLTSVQRLGVASDRLGNQDVVSTVLQSDADKLRQTAELLDRDEFRSAVDAILKAKRIYILGARSAAPLAGFLGYYLTFMFNNVHIVTASGASEMFEKLIGADSEDVVVAFSFPRYSAATVKGAQYCRTTGATVIGFTDSRLSPLGQHCDHVLLAKSDMVSIVDSIVAPLSVVNALIVALAAGREQILTKTFDALERVWEEYNVYEKRVDNQ